ncbi:MAG: diphthine--ammonia ligase [Tenacibaculum sp.]
MKFKTDYSYQQHKAAIYYKSLFSWSGGKDSALALYYALQDKSLQIKELLVNINKEALRVSMHGLRLRLAQKQARAIGMPLNVLGLSSEITMEDYNSLMHGKMRKAKKQGITRVIFGDICLDDLKSYRERQLAKCGIKGHYPLWKKNTLTLVKEFIQLGFKAILIAVDASKLDKSFVGRAIDHNLLSDLPPSVDPCGENGEFHSFVFEGPIFKKPISFKKGEIVSKTYKLSAKSNKNFVYWFQDLY